MRRIQLLLLVTLASLASWAKAAGLPPIGQRTYVIDQQDPHAPVTIKGEGANAPVYLKDPVSPLGKFKVQPVRKAPAKAKVVVKKPRGSRAGSLRFGKLSVSGHVKRPRVEFAREVLPVGRADEPVTPEFFEKVFAPARDADF